MLGANNLHGSAEHEVNMVDTTLSGSTTDWNIDTGANAHMTGEVSLLQNARALVKFNGSVGLPHCEKIQIQQIGSVLTNTLHIYDVLYIPNFKFNLLSVSKFPQLHQCSVLFQPDFCILQDLITGKLSFPSNLITCTTVGNDVWHKRLGHMSVSRM